MSATLATAAVMTTFFIGSINVPGPYFKAKGEGVTVCRLNEQTGAILREGASPRVENAIWMTRAGGVVLVATERYLEPGEVAAYAVDAKTGAFTRVGEARSSKGGAVCHVAVDTACRNAYVSSYLGGVTVHALDASGAVAPARQHFVYPGAGPVAANQEKSHPHQAVLSADGKRLFVCDLGTDKIWVHAVGADGSLGEPKGMPVAPGAGPRHLVLHPKLPLAYVLGELDARVRVYSISGDTWTAGAGHDTLPQGSARPAVGAASAIRLHASGKVLYVANRGADSIAVFSVGADGALSPVTQVPVLGRTPRDFVLSPSGRWLIALHQDSHTARAFELDPATGLPTGKTGPEFATGAPVCAIF